jgi:hypothetical protein
MVTLVGCANSYTLLFLCPIIYLNYFWCIKYHHINIYIYENGKKKWEKKKKKGFPACWAGGNFNPPGRERARGRGRRPTWPISGGDGGERHHGVGPHVSEGRGLTARSRRRRGGELTGARPLVKSRAVLRRGSGSVAGERWRGTGGGRGSRGWGQFDRRGPRVAGPRRGGGRSRW